MKKLLLFLCIVFCYGIVYAEGSIEVSKSELNIKAGETQEFVITANNAAGLVVIKSSNDDVVTADISKHFFDSESDDGKTLNVKLTGKKEGTANVEIVLEDVSSYDEETIEGTKILAVTVGSGNGAATTKESSSNSNTLYFVIGGVVLLALVGAVVATKSKKNTENY